MMRAIVLASLAAGCVAQHNLGDTPKPIGNQRWAATFGGTGITSTTAIAIDGSGDVVAMGAYLGTIDVGEGPVTGAGTGAWLTRRDGASGVAAWAHAFDYSLGAMALDADGNAVVAGGCVPTAAFCQQLGSDSFVTKYGAAGQLLWTRGLGAHAQAQVGSLAVAPDGTIYFDGIFHGTIDVPGSLIGGTNANGRPFLGALTHDGAVRFVRAFDDDAGKLFAAPDGRILMSNDVDHAISIDGVPVRPNAAQSPYIAQLTDDGHVAWAHAFGPFDVVLRPAAFTTRGDDIVFADATAQQNAFPVSTGVTSLDRDGQVQWSIDSKAGRGRGEAIAVAAGGAIVTAGSITFSDETSMDFGAGPQLGTAFLAAYTPDGEFLQSHMFGDRVTSTLIGVSAVATAATGAVAIGGKSQDDALLVMFDAP